MNKVLIVDDDACIRDLLTYRLEKEFHFHITAAKSGRAAIQLLAKGQTFDLIISDYNMIDGNGAELLQFVCEKQILSHFLFFTSEKNLSIPVTAINYLGIISKTESQKLFLVISETRKQMRFSFFDSNKSN